MFTALTVSIFGSRTQSALIGTILLLVLLLAPGLSLAQFGSGNFGSGLYGQAAGGGGDATAPTLSLASGVTTPTTDTTPNFTFSTNEAGTITYSGSCSASDTTASVGNNTITLNTLTIGSYTNCAVRVTDSAGNQSALLNLNNFVIQAVPDTTAPILVLTAPVVTPTTDTTPSFTFTSTEAGTIAYTGACSASDTTANVGSNVITLNTLAIATYTNCAVRVTDGAGNQSTSLSLNTFVIQAVGGGDTFTANDRVRTTSSGVVVYSNRNSSGSNIATKPNNVGGVVVGIEQNGFSSNRFVFVNFANGRDGFVDIDDLTAATPPALPNYTSERNQVPRGTATSTLSHRNETDINSDGIDDREEARISTLINKVRTSSERYNTLRLHSETARIRSFRNVAESELATDSGFSYPVGLYEFFAEVDSGSTETITIYLDDQYNTSGWTYRKFNASNNTYTDISSDVTYGTATVDGETVTTVTYDILDNGPLDQDSRLGFILDPAGPGEVVSSSGGGSSGGGSSRGGGSRSSSNDDDDDGVEDSEVQTTTAATPPSVATAIPSWFTFDTNISFVQPEINDPAAVRFLAQFLNDFEGEQLAVNDTYDAADVAAVQRFQTKYRQEILDIWNLDAATGYVGITTRLKLNFLLQGQLTTCPAFTEFNGGRDGIFRSDEVRRTQDILMKLDLFAGPATGFWDPWTHEALIDFQELFREVMLDPWNITQGTGYKYKTTNKFLNYFVGCDTGAIELEGVGMFDF